jgi:hypothetical protein
MSIPGKLFSGRGESKSQSAHVYIVSGLPRAGTSMMMKMLADGGLPIVTDSLRAADEDNPNGYFEVELSKALKEGEKKWLYNASGKAVKVISYLLEFLPEDITYDIIFMERDIQEILASQKKMLKRRDETPSISDAELASQFHEHLRAVKYWLARKTGFRVLYVNYNEMMKNPEKLCRSVKSFLDQPLDLDAMQAVPNQSLYRNRS